MKKLIPALFLFVCTLTSWDDEIADRFIAGQLLANKYSYEYVQSVPGYSQRLNPYYSQCGWGFYFKFQKTGLDYPKGAGGESKRVPSIGLVFTF